MTVLNITDEVFEQKLVELAGKKHVMLNQQDTQFLIDEALKKQRLEIEDEFSKKLAALKREMESRVSSNLQVDVSKQFTAVHGKLDGIVKRIEALEKSAVMSNNNSGDLCNIKQQISAIQTQARLLSDELMSLRSDLAAKFTESVARSAIATSLASLSTAGVDQG